jgi:hypothetical protein
MWLRASDIAAAVGLNKYKLPKEVASWYIENKNQSQREKNVNEYRTNCSDVKLLVENKGTKEQKETHDLINNFCDSIVKSDDVDKHVKDEIEKVNFDIKRVKIIKEISSNFKKGKDVEKIKIVEKAVITKEILDVVLKDAISIKKSEKSKNVEKRVLESVPESIKNISKSVVNKKRGIQEESNIINTFEINNNTQVEKRNDEVYNLFLEGIKIYGKIDGFSDGKLVEVKNRRNRLFRVVPIYEKVQCEIYMKMLNITECIHVERFDEKDIITEYKSDEKLILKIKEGLRKYKTLYNQLRN